MATFQGKRVSSWWQLILTEARRDVPFVLSDGQRTLAVQRQRVREHGLWSPQNPTGAAYPDPDAPHIRRGRADHAVDVIYTDGGAARLVRWLRAHGCPSARRPIAAEPWHVEIDRDEMRRLVARIRAERDRWRGYTEAERRWIGEYDRLLAAGRDRDRRSVLRRVMLEQRKRVWRAAQQSGWNRQNRRARYKSLLARTR